MTSRFDRLSIIDRGILVFLIVATSSLLLPMSAQAQESNKPQLVFEIKTFKIPKTTEIADMINGNDDTASTQPTIDVPAGPPTPTPVIKTVSKTVTQATKTFYKVPPKATGAARVYMQEPEIRAYVCPKLGDRCNTFMAILAAENGTHECTRDNRGLNKNGSIDIGLSQINWTPSSAYSFEQLQDCKFNLDLALQKVASRGFQPWAAYNKGAYLKHMPAMLASAKAIAASEASAVIDAAATNAVVSTETVVIQN